MFRHDVARADIILEKGNINWNEMKRNSQLYNWESIFKPNTAYAETINILTTTSYTGVVFILTNTIYTKENISNKYNSYKRKQFNKILVKQVSNTLPRVYIYNLFSKKLSLMISFPIQCESLLYLFGDFKSKKKIKKINNPIHMVFELVVLLHVVEWSSFRVV